MTESLLNTVSFQTNPPSRGMSESEDTNNDDYNAHAAAIAEFRKRVIVIDKRDMCLCGLLSLPRSVQLVCAIEVFFSMVLLLQAPDLLKMDGTYFYFLGLFDGKGWWFFALHMTVCLSCVLTSVLLYFGIRTDISILLLPHFIWQISFICLCIALTTVFMALGLYGRMLLPSSIVLSVLLLVPAGFELWWSFLTLQLIRNMNVYRNVYKAEENEVNFNHLPYYSTEI